MTTTTIPQENYEHQTAPAFKDPRNITVGLARVIWTPAIGFRPEGWCLPGGLRTTDKHEAQAWAVNMNALMDGPRPTDFHALGVWSGPK